MEAKFYVLLVSEILYYSAGNSICYLIFQAEVTAIISKLTLLSLLWLNESLKNLSAFVVLLNSLPVLFVKRYFLTFWKTLNPPLTRRNFTTNIPNKFPVLVCVDRHIHIFNSWVILYPLDKIPHNYTTLFNTFFTEDGLGEWEPLLEMWLHNSIFSGPQIKNISREQSCQTDMQTVDKHSSGQEHSSAFGRIWQAHFKREKHSFFSVFLGTPFLFPMKFSVISDLCFSSGISDLNNNSNLPYLISHVWQWCRTMVYCTNTGLGKYMWQ